MKISLICQLCSKEFFECRPSHVRRRKYCSVPCRIQWMKDNFIPYNKGKTKKDFPKLSNSGTYAGHIPWNKGKKIPTMSGENHHAWIKDRTIIQEKHRIRGTLDWRSWRAMVFERDLYTCQECGASGVYIEPHHIIPIRSNMDKLFDTKNGITLCRPCHLKTIRKEEAFIERYSKIVSIK